MTHQPYLDWLFIDPDQPMEALDAEQTAKLRAHLAECPECSQLDSAWQSVALELKKSPLASPKAGFASRWEARLEVERLKQHRRQSLGMLVFSLVGAFVLLAALVILAWPLVTSPGLVLWATVYQLMRWFSIIGVAQQFSTSVLRAADLSFSPMVWLFATGLLTMLGVLWVVSYRFLTIPRSVSVPKN